MTKHKKSTTIFFLYLLLHVLVFVYQVESLPRSNNHILKGATYVGAGELDGPEDIAYDKKSGIIYTGCADGSIKKVYIGKSKKLHTKVESWVNTGGRPLGVALGRHNELIVADAYKGLLNVSKDGSIKLLTDEAEGLRFNLTDGVDVADNGMIYFTDASYKYGLKDFVADATGSEPHGRFMMYDPVTGKTKVLVRDLFFANGVVVSPDQNSVIFCEFSKGNCKRYYIRGVKYGRCENFIDNLPGTPDNIRYDGRGHYWIGIFKKTVTSGDGGILAATLEGKKIAYYTDSISSLTGGNMIGNYLYCSSFTYPYIIKVDLTQL